MLYQLALSKRIQFQHSVLKCACACESGPLLPLGSHPRPSPWLPDAAVLPPVTHDRSCLRPLLCLFLLHNVFPPDIGMAHFLTICLTITLLMRISLTFLTPYLILYRYLYFLYLIFPHRTQHFLTCHLLHCLLQAEYKCQQDKHFCLFSLPRLSPAPRTMHRSEKVLNKYLINE